MDASFYEDLIINIRSKCRGPFKKKKMKKKCKSIGDKSECMHMHFFRYLNRKTSSDHVLLTCSKHLRRIACEGEFP